MQSLNCNRTCALPRFATAQPAARQVSCRKTLSAKRQRLSASPVCSAAVAASPNKQGDRHRYLSGLNRQCVVGYVLVDVILTALPPADKQVFQHDGALEEVDAEIYQLIKQEKGRQVSGDTT